MTSRRIPSRYPGRLGAQPRSASALASDTRIGAGSRFQAALRAEERGWIQ
ncbi:hypothetical protein [Nonomuraea rhodomycinica]|uniref:Uncharacterized protein n=1 Tax=Nonomuraea rhodomycinica TaxID=1712872 RepID=A0A7Y6IUN1_9ACTN|nr:hypothetical protein [Nonomuraea rhodomycinica]NUW44460.1 hypothetical protein [Nonomuraea rhodomycinica]